MAVDVKANSKSKKKSTEHGNAVNKPDAYNGIAGTDISSCLDPKLKEHIQRLSHMRRDKGDGESVPDTPPNETSAHLQPFQPKWRQKRNPFRFSLEIDCMALILLLLGIATRLYRLDQPKHIVFDELHYGKYAQLYQKGTFFFDSQPPLGKQLIALAAHLAGFDGVALNYTFTKIGGAYIPEIPVVGMRLIPAICGSLLIPTVYLLLIEMGLSYWSGCLGAFLLLLDNAMLCQSRFILMDSMVLFFAAFGLLAIMKYHKYHKDPLSTPALIWLCLGAAFLACAIVKFSGFFALCVGVVVIGCDLWKSLADHLISNKQLILHTASCIIAFTVIPLTIYVGVFYIHLFFLTKAGPHDSIMTSHFQASLEGGLASIIRNQPLEVVHGSQITLRHSYGRACWLHSHEDVYPIKYVDGRGSSHQQQVTCYSFKDVNNWWIVKRPERNDLVVSEPKDKIKHGDIIQLVHGLSSRALNSHDVAAPMSPKLQEVSCYIDYNISMPPQILWKVDIVNRDKFGDIWHTVESEVRLIHVNSSQALKLTGKQLPEWGYNQYEVVTDRVINQVDTIWNVEEHRYTKNQAQKDREREIVLHEMIPTEPTQLTFWEKFLELQITMFLAGPENPQQHMYMSDPIEWPFLTRGIAYWVSNSSNAQIHLLGNVVVWYSGTASIMLYGGLLVFYLLRQRRACHDLSQDAWIQFCFVGEVFLGGFLLHFIPYFLVERTLFLHHYFPAFFFKTLLCVALIEHLWHLLCEQKIFRFGKQVFLLLIGIWMLSILYVFKTFSVFSYGMTPLSPEDIQNLRWKDSWDFIIHKK
ncbi:unnamed protein product [Darwinula stevensoni]|uniref:Protein O-mannosyltransferase 1 n=1 Tax=Darwinula stevensoni TaxID=69355 RepID=A0A7R8X0L2_9CRUS|nr:unnamed protein product [Darwinula stevensoni]CAG0881288.1 unnamed protein product [Darwinula stevensoni]